MVGGEVAGGKLPEASSAYLWDQYDETVTCVPFNTYVSALLGTPHHHNYLLYLQLPTSFKIYQIRSLSRKNESQYCWLCFLRCANRWTRQDLAERVSCWFVP